jgi:predicted dehydrogenase
VSKSISVGLVGCGQWGRYILRDLVSLGCAVSVVARSEESRRRAQDGGAVAVVDRPEALPRVAGVVVAAPTETRPALIEALLERGCPIFTEKPLASDLPSAERLTWMAAGRLFVMDKWRYHPGVETLAEIARSGELGPVRGLRLSRVQWGNPHADVDGVWNLAPHDLAIALEILGHLPEPRGAVAEHSGAFAESLVGLLGEDPWVVMEVSTRSPERRRDLRLHCREGVAFLEEGCGDTVAIVRTTGSGASESAVAERRRVSTELPLFRELRVFVDHLRGGPPPCSSAIEGLDIVRALTRLRELAGLETPEEL